jgi:GntR family transcriptional regulator
VRKVAKDARINLNTVARAYRALEEEGLLETVRGRGTTVKAERAKKRVSRRDLSLLARDLCADAVLGGHPRGSVRGLLQ